MSATQQVTGLVSGFDTASIVESLMTIERSRYDKTSEKVQAEKVKLQAYQSINTMLSSFAEAVSTISSSKLWNSKTTSSSNESSLTATANQYATEGSYSFRTAQLATTASYLSQGYSSATSNVLSSGSGQTSGTITLESSQARVDNSAKIEELNGGKGIYRGSIRVTDSSGSTAVVDLSACETIDEVLQQINSAGGIQVKATINDQGTGINIADLAQGSSSLRIQNVGQGTTATDLGIAGSSTTGTLSGTGIHYLSGKTLLSSLNDGQGVEEGMMCITLREGTQELDIAVDLNGLTTLGDVLDKVNAAIAESAAANGSFGGVDTLQLAVNDDGNGLTFTGGKTGVVYTVTNIWGSGQMAQPETVDQLGLLGTYSVSSDGDSFGGSRLIGDLTSPLLSSLSGANKQGIGDATAAGKVAADTLDSSTLLADLNGGKGIEIDSNAFQMRIYEGGGDSFRLVTDVLDYDYLRAIVNQNGSTVGDLVDYMNNAFATSGLPSLENITVEIDSTGKGLYFSGLSEAHDYDIAGTLATSLGLVHMDDGDDANGWGSRIKGSQTGSADLADLYSFDVLADAGQQITETTTLSELYINGTQIDQSQLDAMLTSNAMTMTIGSGGSAVTVTVDLSALDGDSTLEQMANAINSQIHEQVKAHDPDMSAPFLAIEYNSTGLNWRNVDLTEDLTVSGTLADTIGIDKTYAGTDHGYSSTEVQKNLNPVMVGSGTAVDITGTESLASLNSGSGLSLTGDKLTLTFGADGGAQSIVSVSRSDLIAALGGSVGNASLNDYVSALNSLFADAIDNHVDLNGTGAAVTFGISADGKGITITSAAGTADGQEISLSGGMATAASTGLAATTVKGGSAFEEPEAADIRGVNANPVTLSGVGYIVLDIGGTEVTFNTDGVDKNSTLNDLLRTLNSQAAAYDLEFTVSDSGTGIALSNNSSKSVTIKNDPVSTLASDLGLCGTTASGTDAVVSANSHMNGSSLNKNYISRATELSTLNNGEGADLGTIMVTNAQGTSVTIDLSGCLTMGDVIDAINGTIYGMKARINDAGDGIVIEQTDDLKQDGSGNVVKGNISISSYDGSNTAEHLGIAGVGTGGEDGLSVLNGSMKTVIQVGATDTLTDIMNRIAAANAGYKTSIINDGTGTNSHRLSITASSSGAASDFIIDTDIASLTMQQVTRGQDGIVLYGTPDSGVSPVMLKSSSNSNNQAINGLTLELNSVSDSYTTITVSKDTGAIVEAFENLVQAYNDLSDLITYCDSYDYENETQGILFSDTNIRNLMDTIDNMFYQVYNPNNLSYGDIAKLGTKSTWTWMDIGIGFSTNNTASDGESGSYFSRMELDTEALEDMINNNWATLASMMSGTRNASDSTLGSNVAATSTFSYNYDVDENGNVIYPEDATDPNLAIDGDKSTMFVGNKTIDEGENTYTVYFQQATTLERVSIYHPDSSESLSDFIVEYLDSSTGKWETLREVSGNSSSSTILGFGQVTTVSAVRVTASATNADDGKFRLLDIQCLETTGLGGQMNNVAKQLTDVIDGWYVSIYEDVNERIADLQANMEKMQVRLDAKETLLYNQFTAMEKALSQLQSQGSSISSMLDSLSNSSS